MLNAKKATEITKTEAEVLKEAVEFQLQELDKAVRHSASQGLNSTEVALNSVVDAKLINELNSSLEANGYEVSRKKSSDGRWEYLTAKWDKRG